LFRNHLASWLVHLGYESTRGDPDVWIHAATKTSKEEYYEYLFVYTDDILAIGIDPDYVPIHPPDDYLGTKLKETVLPNGVKAWGQSSSHYIQNSVANLEVWMKDKEYKLPKKAPTPMVASFRPEVDVTPLLDPLIANYYQSIIGVLRWIVENGRMEITTEVSMLSSHVAMPREGHLYAVFRVFAYLKAKHNSRLIFDPTYPNIPHECFKAYQDWEPFYVR
jgi:hypothetical protein